MADKWSQYVPFNRGDKFGVNGPGSYDGEGEIVDLNEGVLEFSLHLPLSHSIFTPHKEMDVHFWIDYVAEGSGNKASGSYSRKAVDGKVDTQEFKDDNVIVQSSADTRRIQSSVLIQGKPLVVKISKDGDELDLKIQGYSFTATRKDFFQD